MRLTTLLASVISRIDRACEHLRFVPCLSHPKMSQFLAMCVPAGKRGSNSPRRLTHRGHMSHPSEPSQPNCMLQRTDREINLFQARGRRSRGTQGDSCPSDRNRGGLSTPGWGGGQHIQRENANDHWKSLFLADRSLVPSLDE